MQRCSESGEPQTAALMLLLLHAQLLCTLLVFLLPADLLLLRVWFVVLPLLLLLLPVRVTRRSYLHSTCDPHADQSCLCVLGRRQPAT